MLMNKNIKFCACKCENIFEYHITPQQSVCPINFDMGLLTKALEIVWSRTTEFEGVLPMEGSMHLLMSVFAVVGFLYGDAGLKNMLFESDVYARGTADRILSDKDYDRAMRALFMVDEALQRHF